MSTFSVDWGLSSAAQTVLVPLRRRSCLRAWRVPWAALLVGVLAGCAVGAGAQAPLPATATATAAPLPATAGSVQPALAPATTTTLSSVEVDGVHRSYLAVAPAGQHAGLPLLVVLHGRSVTVRDEAIRTGFLPLAQRGDAVVVYPVGIGQSWNAGEGCCGEAAATGSDDAAFVDEVATDAARRLGIDSTRRYLVGYSNGGKLAFRVVCEHPRTFTAFATYGAVPLAPCANRTAAPVSALISAGTADPELTTADPPRTATQAVQDTAALWRASNGCAPAATVTQIDLVTLTSWTDCRDGAAVAAALYSGLTHYWPTAAPSSVVFSTAVGTPAAAATLMWRFLSRHRGD